MPRARPPACTGAAPPAVALLMVLAVAAAAVIAGGGARPALWLALLDEPAAHVPAALDEFLVLKGDPS